MPFFRDLADRSQKFMDGMALEFKRHTDMATLRAAVGIVLRTGYNDGDFDGSEKKKGMAVLTSHPMMAHFKRTDILKLWSELDAMYAIDVDMGNSLADEWLTGAAGKPEAVRRVIVTLGCAVGGADGNFDAGEVTVVAQSSRLMNINPAHIPPLALAAEANGVKL